MAPDPGSNPVNRVVPKVSRAGKIRLVLRRLASGYYQRRDVLREVAKRILRA